jgi:hypothetical protein
MPRSATITMRLPYGRITSQTVTAQAGKPLRDRIKLVVAQFASRRGVSEYAVDYDVWVGA